MPPRNENRKPRRRAHTPPPGYPGTPAQFEQDVLQGLQQLDAQRLHANTGTMRRQDRQQQAERQRQTSAGRTEQLQGMAGQTQQLPPGADRARLMGGIGDEMAGERDLQAGQQARAAANTLALTPERFRAYGPTALGGGTPGGGGVASVAAPGGARQAPGYVVPSEQQVEQATAPPPPPDYQMVARAQQQLQRSEDDYALPQGSLSHDDPEMQRRREAYAANQAAQQAAAAQRGERVRSIQDPALRQAAAAASRDAQLGARRQAVGLPPAERFDAERKRAGDQVDAVAPMFERSRRMAETGMTPEQLTRMDESRRRQREQREAEAATREDQQAHERAVALIESGPGGVNNRAASYADSTRLRSLDAEVDRISDQIAAIEEQANQAGLRPEVREDILKQAEPLRQRLKEADARRQQVLESLQQRSRSMPTDAGAANSRATIARRIAGGQYEGRGYVKGTDQAVYQVDGELYLEDGTPYQQPEP